MSNFINANRLYWKRILRGDVACLIFNNKTQKWNVATIGSNRETIVHSTF